ncbi:MAG TPA: YoaK family protein [Dongiaceae bacterium]|nr:YoaK family protein [Dongiaceae bacterium]
MPLSHKTAKSAVALLLTFAAGMVDIVAYISLYHVFVAHMTGTTVHLGNTLVLARWTSSAKSAVVLISFVLGSVLGRSIIEFGSRTRKRTIASITLTVEALLVLAFIWAFPRTTPIEQAIPVWKTCAFLGLLATAMGLQTATLTRIGPLTIHTTFVTGMLNKLAQSLSQWMFWVHDNWRRCRNASHSFQGSGRHPAFRHAQLMAAIWFCYIVGSVTGTWMQSRWSTGALYLPVSLLMIAAVVDHVQPLSIEEEADQP